jgi:hypothetical protein
MILVNGEVKHFGDELYLFLRRLI